MPVTGNILSRADLLTSLNADIKNSPATLIRGDVLAQKIADLQESAVNIVTDYSANNSIIFKSNGGVITNLAVAASRIIGRKASGEIAAMTVAEVNTLLGASSGSSVFYVPLTKGVGNTYTGTATGLSAYTSNAVYFFTFDIIPAGAPFTADLNSLGAIAFKKPNGSTDLPAAAVNVAGAVYEFAYNGTSWVPESKVNIRETGGLADIIVNTTAVTSGTSGAIPYNDNGVYQEDQHNLFYDPSTQNIGFGTNGPTAKVHIKGEGATSATDSLLIQNSASTLLMKMRNDGCISIGYGSSNNNIGVTLGYEAVNSGNGGVAMCYQAVVSAVNGLAIGDFAVTSGGGGGGFGFTPVVTFDRGFAFGYKPKAGAVGAFMFASSTAQQINDLEGSFKFASQINNGVVLNQQLFISAYGNLVLNQNADIRFSNYTTLYDSVADNVWTIANPTVAANTIAVTSVSSSSGALFNHASTVTSYRPGDRVVTSGFGVYNNQTYFYGVVTATSFKLYTTRANALTGTSPVAFISTDTGTVTPQSRTTTAAIADSIQIQANDTDDATSSLAMVLEQAVVSEAVTSDRTLKITINGTLYKILLKS